MKIAYVLAEYPSLSETFIAREIEALRRRGFEVDIWALKAGTGARQIPVSNIARVSARLRGANESRWQHIGEAWARGARERIKDVQHIHAGWASFPAAVARGAAGVLHVPWSFSGHARDLWVEGENLAEKVRAAKFASVCTRAGAEYLRGRVPECAHKVLYAPHGIELSKYGFSHSREIHRPPSVLAVGRLVEKKGFLILLAALAKLSAREYSVRATIIGEGPQRSELQKQITPDFEARLIGARSHAEVIEAMHESDLLVMPSTLARDGDRDGLPNVLLEAAACGLPIVATRAGAIEDFLDESCAWLCAPGDASILASAIQSALQDFDERLRRARAAHTRVQQHFDVDQNIEVLARALRNKVLADN